MYIERLNTLPVLHYFDDALCDVALTQTPPSDGTGAVLTLYVENDIIDKGGNPGKMTPRVTIVKELRDGQWKQIHGDATFSITEIKAME